MKKRYYIAYGSNLNIKQMSYRCPNAKIVGKSVVEGYKLLFKGSRTGVYFTIEPKINGKVPVGVWEVTEKDEIALDRYEGFPIFYYKKEMKLIVKNIKNGKETKRKGFVYIMREDRPKGLPTSFYVNTCLEGYESFGFDEDILIDAYNKSKNIKE